MLTKTFNTKIREDLVDIAYGLADATPPSMLLDHWGKPIIIQIEGCANAGKSLFWDEYTKALLGNSARMMRKFASDYFLDDKCRFPELWGGDVKGENLRILFFNAGVCEPCAGGELLSFIRQVERKREPFPRERGDVLMINNFQEMAAAPIPFDIKIDIMNTQKYVPEGVPIPEMSRTTRISVQGEIANNAAMKKFML